MDLEEDKGSSFSGFTGLQHSSVTMLIKSLLLPSKLALKDPCRQAQVDTNVKPLGLITLYKCHSERKGSLHFFTSFVFNWIRVSPESITSSKSLSTI